MSLKTPKKRIDILIPDFGDLGAQRVAINAANCLAVNHRVRFIVFSRKGPFEHYLNKDIEIFEIDQNIINIPKIRVISRIVNYSINAKKNDVDLAISFSPITNLCILFARMVNKKLKTIVQEHASPKMFLNDRENMSFISSLIYKYIFIKFYNFSDIFVTTTNEIREDFVKYFGVKNNPEFFCVIRNPLDVEGIKKLAEEEIDDFQFDKTKNYIIGAGRLSEQKNFDRLIDIFAIAGKKEPTLELIILGRGPLEIELKKHAAKTGLENRIHFLGFKNNPDKYLRAAGVFCLTSTWEALPQIIAEAMVSGSLVIANDCHAGPAEMIVNEKTGFLIPYGNLEKFSQKILFSVKNPKKIEEVKKAALLFAEKEYSLDKYRAEYDNLIERLFAK